MGKVSLLRTTHKRIFRRGGFTLIELLVVIAIIALLLSIITPALRKAKKQARKLVCLAHLRSMGYAGVLYSNANEGQYPYCHMDTPNANEAQGRSYGSYAVWIDGLTNFSNTNGYIAHGLFFHHGLIDDPKVFYCPGNRNETLKYGVPSGQGGGWPEGLVPDDLGPSQIWIQTTYHYRSLWDEREWRSVNLNKDSGGTAFMADVFSDPSRGVEYHHEDGYNVVYADGHGTYFRDKQNEILEFGGGQTYHTFHSLQDTVWKKYFDEMKKYDFFQ